MGRSNYLTSAQVARMAEMTPQTIQTFIRDGKLSASRTKDGYKIRRKDAEAFVQWLRNRCGYCNERGPDTTWSPVAQPIIKVRMHSGCMAVFEATLIVVLEASYYVMLDPTSDSENEQYDYEDQDDGDEHGWFDTRGMGWLSP